MTIYEGDTPLLKFNLSDSLGPVNLTNGTLKLLMKINNIKTEKTEITITDAANGKCEIQLRKTDLTVGECYLQPVISYLDNREFAFSPSSFKVEARI